MAPKLRNIENTSMFHHLYKRPFKKDQKIQTMNLKIYGQLTILILQKNLSLISNRSDIIKTEANEVSPIENAIATMTSKNEDLERMFLNGEEVEQNQIFNHLQWSLQEQLTLSLVVELTCIKAF